ncbi:hypothetical protein V1511DRAFT_521300 [Dipodascopsis uninucleata]
MTTAVTVPYMILTEPERSDLLFISSDAFKYWNDPIQSQRIGEKAPRSFDNIGAVQNIIEKINLENESEAAITVDRRSGKTATITISGTSTTVVNNRAKILKKYYKIGIDHVGIDTFLFLDTSSNVRQHVAEQLNAIASYSSTAIFISKVLDSSLRPQNPTPLEIEDIWKPYHVLIYGDLDSISFAKIRISIMIDDLNGLFVDRMAVPLSLHPLLSGRDNFTLSDITQKTRTKIYTPSTFPCVHASMDEDHARRDYNELYIVGDERDVDAVREMIADLLSKIPIFTKDFVVQFAKIDYLLLHMLDKLEELSRHNGVFIQFPSLGGARSLIRVQCTSKIFVEETIKSVAKMTCDVYSAGYWIHEDRTDENGFLIQPPGSPPLGAIREALERISSSTGADISFLKCTFELSGNAEATKASIPQIRGLPFWQTDAHQVRFRVELSVEQSSFISGKKNGKINRIMNTSHAWVKFEPFSEYNFFVDLVSSNYSSALYGIQLLEEELPAEISFYIPEMYHRSMIGAKGEQIQRLMKKYNVFVKFSSNSQDASSSQPKIDNVVVRCPAKNGDSLEPAKREIFDLMHHIEAQQNTHHGHSGHGHSHSSSTSSSAPFYSTGSRR